MKLRNTTITLLIACAVLLILHQPATSEKRRLKDVRATIEDIVDQYEEAYGNQDAAAVADFYCEDAEVYIPLRGKAVGREEIEEYHEILFESGIKRVIVRINEIYAAGDMAYDIGEYSVFGEKGKFLAKGHYMTLWKKENGKWKIFRDMATS